MGVGALDAAATGEEGVEAQRSLVLWCSKGIIGGRIG